jgi:glycosyltransferase involved in cell wall biosynthesis
MRRGVAILTSLFPPSVGGIQTHTLALARALAALGCEVHVVTRPASGRAAREALDGVTVHRVGLAEAKGPAATLAYVTLAARTVAGLGGRVGVLHAHQMLSPASAAMLSRAVRRTPLVVTAHASGAIGEVAHLARQGPLGSARLAALRRLASAFVAVSDPIRDELVGAGIPGARIRRIPNGVDTRRFAAATPAERARLRSVLGLSAGPVAVYTGRLAPEKGVDVLVESWGAARRGAGWTLCLVGDGPERAALEEQVRRLGLAESVRLVGATGDVAPWLRAADVFVLPSRTEGLSVSLLEAMACGLGVIATDVGATAETAGREGALLVPPERPAALAAALETVLGDPGRAQALGASARARVVEGFGIEGVAARHLELYREVGPAA